MLTHNVSHFTCRQPYMVTTIELNFQYASLSKLFQLSAFRFFESSCLLPGGDPVPCTTTTRIIFRGNRPFLYTKAIDAEMHAYLSANGVGVVEQVHNVVYLKK